MIQSGVFSKWFLGAFATLSIAVVGCGSDGNDANDPSDPNANDPNANAAASPSESSAPPEAPLPPPDMPVPLSAPVGQWTWFDIPGAVCGDGSPTGLGVNRGTGNEVVVFMEGGGGCWDELSCGGLKTADHIKGYGPTNFASDFANPARSPAFAAPLTIHGTFDRTWDRNPFKDASYVYLPYCTGDIFSGDAEMKFRSPPRTMHFKGRKNVEAYVSQILAAFPDATRVTLTGRSGGGFGSAISYWRFQEAFGDVPVDLIDDSGPPMNQSTIPLFPIWKAAWNMDGAFPPDCAECRVNLRNAATYYSKKYPNSRFALLSYDNDAVISAFFFQPPPFFVNNLNDLTFNVIRPLPNFRYFIPSGFDHTMSHHWDVTAGKMALSTFLNDMHAGSPAWSNKTPTGVTCPAADGTASGSAEAKYLELGACGSVLGAPVTGELVSPDLFGRYTQFQNGSIYWHPNTGAHEVHGDIRQEWKRLGWERSDLGYPTTDETDTTAGGGRKNMFQGGAIYETAKTGAHGVFGAIYTTYASLGAEASELGFPTTGEIAMSSFGTDRLQRFEHGTISWKRLTNATTVSLTK